MDPSVLKKLNQARSSRQAAIVVTSLDDGRDRLVLESDTVEGLLGAEISRAFRIGKSNLLKIDDQEVFLNVHVPPPRIVVIGAVHISQALAGISKIAGYDLEVIDPRTAFATSERFGNTRLFAEWPEDVLSQYPLDAYCAVAAVTHDPKIDDYALASALAANCFYVGALGSRKTHAKRIDRLKSEGVSHEALERIHAPIGLNIGASNPQEIATAIMAEIIASFRNRSVGTTE